MFGLLVLFMLTVAAPEAKGAEFAIVPGSLAFRTIDGAGMPDNRAGAHPDRLQIQVALSSVGTGTTARDLVFELPPGLGVNPDAVPACPRAALDADECPSDTQVGVTSLEIGGQKFRFHIFDVEPAPGQLAGFAIEVPAFGIHYGHGPTSPW